jgi:DnaJ-class molecular chaperone
MNPYEILGIEKTATSSEIKKAYHKNAIKHHPDKGGDHEKFQEISKAYQILSDPKKREKYDRFGVIDDNATNDIDPTEIFANLFGGMGMGGQPFNMNFGNGGSFSFGGFPGGMRFRPGSKVNINGKVYHVDENGRPVKKADDIVEQIQLSLTEMYNGKQIIIMKKYKVTIEPGSYYGKKFTFKGKGQKGTNPDEQDGDLIIILVPSRNDEIQERNRLEQDENGNLLYTKSINIIESLIGIEYELYHPDGKKYIIKEDDLIQYDNNIKVIPNKGLPKNKDKTEFGDLVIKYEIHYREIGSGILTRMKKIYQTRELSKSNPSAEILTSMSLRQRQGQRQRGIPRSRSHQQNENIPGECNHQ